MTELEKKAFEYARIQYEGTYDGTFDEEDIEAAFLAGAAAAQEWIPCSERLPEKLRKVLVHTRFNDCACTATLEDNYWSVDDAEYDYTDIENVTHWLPLPPVPGKEE